MLVFSLFLAGCSDNGFNIKSSTSVPAVQYKPEPTYDETPRTIVPEAGFTTISVSGTAEYQRRRFDPGLASSGALSYVFDSYPIPCAEFNVYDSNNNLVQAGATNADGSYSFNLSSKTASYTMIVRSRAANNCLKVSVLSDINTNLPYGVSKTISITGSNLTAQNLLASANEAVSPMIEGGAFNILFQIYRANKFLRDKSVLSPSASADKVSVFWQAGFTPYAYYGYPTSPISFYEPGQSKLYICGGIQGNVDSSDTDHFDDSVILHEYGHFLEDRHSRSDSPGGSHNGDFIIDARLAWSEGWANFLQSAVRQHFGDASKEMYIDTYGHKVSSGDFSGYGINVKFKLDADLNLGGSSVVRDIPTYTSEGVFREMGIARTLYKLLSSSYESSKVGGSVPFGRMWTAFTNISSSNQLLANFATFAANLKSTLTTNSEWASRTSAITAIYSEERQPASTIEYGSVLSQSGSACPTSMNTSVNSYYGSEWRSNQLRSNDFYSIYYNGSSQLIVELEKTSVDSLDIDLFIYKNSYSYQESSSTKSNSSLVLSSQTRNSITKETLNFSGLPAGNYVINVKAYTESGSFAGGSLTYQLRSTQSGGGYLCPTTMVTQ